MTSRHPFAFDPETGTTTCQDCEATGQHTESEEEAALWHSAHRPFCAPSR
ncbi:hypothetical protein RMN57_36390 [Kitasatospora sp. CM 4170]|uniref:Uncharacterized protein n=1 Tax=Kitasatospora aburaviensis TaxID=67265 RepID=A0ABW1F558_9ACTN|nr:MULTISPECIES: hypothetical protein [unclassified Kitasatospora]MCG6498830.1 hypothetical protein [Kitasatospora sp. A2-31]WNM49792.1 hypothetical protein RMN57_36390 [Kitasatospora sp. CM 4170]